MAATQYILGVRPDWTGLVVDPCVPADWKEFSVTRKFRGATYNISVKNPNGVFKGVQSLTVDGVRTGGIFVPDFGDDGTHTVEVVMEGTFTTKDTKGTKDCGRKAMTMECRGVGYFVIVPLAFLRDLRALRG